MCLNASATVTIPLSGSTPVTIYDQSCNPLPGTACQVTVSGAPLGANTLPAVSGTAAGLSFSANGAAPGAAGTFTVKYLPNGQTTVMTFVVGGPVTSISAGTPTP
jgi:hypothetical protein